jgi:hypothetical protein
MSEMQTVEVVEVRFTGAKLASYTDDSGAYTLYRTPEGLYCIHIDEGAGGLAWLESGLYGTGLTEEQVRTLFPEFEAATTRPGRVSSLSSHFPTSGNVNV